MQEGCARPPKTQQKDGWRNPDRFQDFCMTEVLEFCQERIAHAGGGVQQASCKPQDRTVMIDLGGQTLPRIPRQSQSALHE